MLAEVHLHISFQAKRLVNVRIDHFFTFNSETEDLVLILVTPAGIQSFIFLSQVINQQREVS